MNIEKSAERLIWKILQSVNIEFSVAICGRVHQTHELDFNIFQASLLREKFIDFLYGVYGPISTLATPAEQQIRESILSLTTGPTGNGILTSSFTLSFVYPDGRPTEHYHVSLMREGQRTTITSFFLGNVSIFELAEKQYQPK